MKVLGLAGASGSGKTTLIRRLLPELVRRGVAVSTVKHTHHDVDPDAPGKDSRVHREAGAREVMLAGPRRAILVQEYGAGQAPGLGALIARLAPVDLVLVEGFREDPFPKIEVYRPALGRGRLVADDAAGLLAVASDVPLPDAAVPVLDLNDAAAVAAFIVARVLAGEPA